MSKNQLIALAGVGLMLVGNFLPFAKALWLSISLWDGDDGKILLVIVALAVVGIVLRWNIFALVMAVAGAGVAIINMVDVSGEALLKVQIGGYVIVIGAVVAAVGAILAMGDKRKDKEAPTA